VCEENHYNKEYHKKRHINLIVNDEYFWARAEASKRLYFQKEEINKRIMEFGCGIGQTIAMIPNARGWDVSSEARAICRKRKIMVYENLEDIPKKEWDIVFCRHVLEHVENPLSALTLIRELIAEGGELYLILPKENHFYCHMDQDLNKHFYCWNFRAINNLLIQAGFLPYANYYKYVLGYRALLPIRRILGKSTYYYFIRFIGWVKRNGELVIRAKLA